MKKSFLILMVMFTFLSCTKISDKKNDATCTTETKKTHNSQHPVLHVYNMGGVPEMRMEKLLAKLEDVYPVVVYDGLIPLDEKTHIKTDKGSDRYGATWIMEGMKRLYSLQNSIQLIVVNADVCDWKYNERKKRKEPHALFGDSYLNGWQSVVGFSRFVKTKRLTDENLFKVVIHELGHSVGGLVPNRRCDGGHCPNKSCLMVNANNGFPYTTITRFCDSCDKVMRSKGFDTSRLELK